MAVAFETWGANTGTSSSTAVTPGDDTKGSYAQLIASTGITTKNIWVIMSVTGTGNIQEYLVDIATGAAASEVVVVPNLYCAVQSGRNVLIGPIRVDIASGVRVAARAETSFGVGTEEVSVSVVATDADIPALTSTTITAEGDRPGTTGSKGTAIDPGATANTKGAWVEIVASAPASAELMYLVLGPNANSALTTLTQLVDIGIGAASSEVVEIADLHITATGGGDQYGPTQLGPFPCTDMQSQRVAVRSQCNLNTPADDITFSVVAFFVAGTVPSGGSGGGVKLAGMSGGLVG